MSVAATAPAGMSTFPDAPDGAVTPPSAGVIFRTRLKQWRRTNLPWIAVWLVLQLLAPVVLAAANLVLIAVVVGCIGLVIAVIFCIAMWGKAQKAFWDAYAKARGLEHDENSPTLHSDVPLLHKGDKRKVHRVLTGRIGVHPAHLAQYTYTDITYTTDSDGHRQRNETDYDFTLVCHLLPEPVAARYLGVYMRKNTLSLGSLQDKLQHDRAVQLESAVFNKRYDLRVVDEQDDIALYELFSTPFVDHLAHTVFVQWEQVGPYLVVYRKGHTTDSDELDRLCKDSVDVFSRYCEEYH